MKDPTQRKARRQVTKRLRKAPCAETFTAESAKDYVLDLFVRGKLGAADKRKTQN